VTGCRKQQPEVESGKEKVREMGTPRSPPLTHPACPWCHQPWPCPVPASCSLPKGSVGWMCPPGAPRLLRPGAVTPWGCRGPAGAGIHPCKEPGAMGLPSGWLCWPPWPLPVTLGVGTWGVLVTLGTAGTTLAAAGQSQQC